MSTHVAHDELLSQLIRRGLPLDYAERAATEFTDHHHDLVTELRAAGCDESTAAAEATRRLGDPRTLVTKTVREHQRCHWCGRWPLVTFLFGPIALLVLLCTAILLVAYLLCQAGFVPNADGVLTTGDYVGKYLLMGTMLFAAPAAVMTYLARLAKQAAMAPGWICASAVILAMFVGLWACDFRGDRMNVRAPIDQPLMGINLPILFTSWHSVWKWYNHDALQIIQYLLPLGCAAVMILRTKQLTLRVERLAIARNSFQGGMNGQARCA